MTSLVTAPKGSVRDMYKTKDGNAPVAAIPQASKSTTSVRSVKMREGERKEKKKIIWGLTLSVEKDYFWGRAGLIRIGTLIVASIALLLGFPGYASDDPKTFKVGYGESVLINLGLAINGVCILMSFTFIFLLVTFADVRCQNKWDDWNMQFNCLGCFLMIFAGFFELIGTYNTRMANCPVKECESNDIYDYHRSAVHKPPSFRPRYFNFHYSAWVTKLATAMLYCISSRIMLKNDEQ